MYTFSVQRSCCKDVASLRKRQSKWEPIASYAKEVQTLNVSIFRSLISDEEMWAPQEPPWNSCMTIQDQVYGNWNEGRKEVGGDELVS